MTRSNRDSIRSRSREAGAVDPWQHPRQQLRQQAAPDANHTTDFEHKAAAASSSSSSSSSSSISSSSSSNSIGKFSSAVSVLNICFVLGCSHV